jgi:hypothetical protein
MDDMNELGEHDDDILLLDEMGRISSQPLVQSSTGTASLPSLASARGPADRINLSSA